MCVDFQLGGEGTLGRDTSMGQLLHGYSAHIPVPGPCLCPLALVRTSFGMGLM